MKGIEGDETMRNKIIRYKKGRRILPRTVAMS